VIKYLRILGVITTATTAILSGREPAPRGTVRTRQAQHGKVGPMATATFGAGCFWGVEQAFRETPGVIATAVGYTGGTVEHPSYEAVCDGKTGHTEAVRVEYDPEQIGYEKLLDVFWALHDPTRRSKAQYKSVIYYHTPEQQQAAEASKAQHAGAVTDILPAHPFYLAEDYHQHYYEKRGITGHGCGL